ncbi:hypothetical protein Salmuc_00187 [Salipiger mucosus DSM 16094]|uniref:Uncharacterized protein n=1 Tax=Salipiger mucosus DSM 16094 TaxID=1123237 RepID=S9QQF4_9RHOB|nr:hypothetical protein Salmuc_00187 [Salipiger mucosus DSM 16094]
MRICGLLCVRAPPCKVLSAPLEARLPPPGGRPRRAPNAPHRWRLPAPRPPCRGVLHRGG